jgi:CRP-like cAMP-binding protein
VVLDHPLLAVLEPDERRSIDERLLRRSLAPGKVCIEEGAITTEFFLVLRGCVEVSRGGRRVASLEAGEFFGESGALDPGPGYTLARNATVTAREATELGVMTEGDFSALIRSSEPFRTMVYAQLGEIAERADG